MSEIPLKSSEEIKFGLAATFTNPEIFHGYLVFAFNSHDAIATVASTHPWVSLLVAYNTVFQSVKDESFNVATPAAYTSAVGMLNLGRLARLRMQSETYTWVLDNIATELNKKVAGAQCATATGSAEFAEVAKWVCGGAMDGFIGSWNSTKYKPADDILAGCIIVLCYVMFFWTGFLKQYKKLVKKLGTFSSIDGVLRGNYRNLQTSDPSTWGSLLLQEENIDVSQFGTTANTHTTEWAAAPPGLSFFGLSQAMVDDPVLRGVECTIYTHANAFWDKLLTRSEWEWRHAKTLSFEPIFLPMNHHDANAAVTGTHADVHGFNSVQLFSASAGDQANDWRWFNSYVNETVSEFVDFFFKNSSFGKIKSLFSVVKFSALPDVPEIGLGGIMLHQITHWADGGASADVFKTKFNIETSHNGHRVMCLRRASDTNTRFQTIGDITIQDYRVLCTLFGNSHCSLDHGVTSEQIGGVSIPVFAMMSAFGFVVTRTEDRGPVIDRRICWLVGDPTEDAAFEYANGSANAHALKAVLMLKTWVASTTGTTQYPIHADGTKVLYYAGRACDPYKKLKHETHDMNHLDADLVRRDMISLFWPASGGSVKADPIVVSAIPFKKPGEIVAEEVAPVEQPVSSVLSANKAVTEAKKDVKIAEKELSAEKKKEANK